MKRFLALTLALVLAVSLAACGKAQPAAASAVKEAIESVKSADMESMQGSFNGELDGLADLFGTEDMELLQLVTNHISYTIDGVIESEDGPTVVTVTITAVDASQVMGRFMKDFMTYALQFAFLPADEQPDEGEIEATMMQMLREALEDPNLDTVETTLDVELNWDEAAGKWHIANEFELGDAVLGGLFSWMETVTDSLQQILGK